MPERRQPIAAVTVHGSMTSVRTLIRRELNDPDTNRSGLTIPAAQRRYQDAELTDAIVYTVLDLENELTGRHLGHALTSVDTSYGGNTNTLAWPAPMHGGHRVVKIEDITQASRPAPIPYVSPLEIESYASAYAANYVPNATYRYTVVSLGADPAIQIRPRPTSALPIRIWYLGAPVVPMDPEPIPLTAQWLELVVLKACRKLARREDELSSQQAEDLLELMRQFRDFANRQRGPQRIRKKRQGLS